MWETHVPIHGYETETVKPGDGDSLLPRPPLGRGEVPCDHKHERQRSSEARAWTS
jgi:hypothetical protein